MNKGRNISLDTTLQFLTGLCILFNENLVDPVSVYINYLNEKIPEGEFIAYLRHFVYVIENKAGHR